MSERHPNGYWAPDPGEVPSGVAHPSQRVRELPAAAASMVGAARASAQTLTSLYALRARFDIPRREIDAACGGLWTALRQTRADVVAAGHPGGRDGHAGCPLCALVNDLNELVRGAG